MTRRGQGTLRWRRLIGGASALATGVLAASFWPSGCASGGASEGDGGQGPVTSSAPGGSGGAGGEPLVGRGGSGGSGGEPAVCEAAPCKLTAPQCGCSEEQKCTLSSVGDRLCAEAGEADWGAPCTPGECSAGHICLGNFGPPNSCHKFCEDDGDCLAPGGICARGLHSASDEKICTANCDAISGVGCEAEGAKCHVFREPDPPNLTYSLCIRAGTGVHGASCTAMTDCAPGLNCVTVDTGTEVVVQCLRWCNLAVPQCPDGAVCYPLNDPVVIGSISYGICF